MISREDLIKSKEYWLEKIQNMLFVEIEDYMKKNNLNKTKFAKKLGVSKSYLSQILNGNFDHKLSKLIELSLAIEKVPRIKFEEIEKCLAFDAVDKLAMTEDYKINVKLTVDYTLSKFPNEVKEKGIIIQEKNRKRFYHQYTQINENNNKILA